MGLVGVVGAAVLDEGDVAAVVGVGVGDFNVHRALGERVRDASDIAVGAGVIRRNLTELPRFARSLDTWLAVLGD